MKKIFSLLMVISIMILSIGTSFAAVDNTVATGLNAVAVEDENGLITVTVSADMGTDAVKNVVVCLKLNGIVPVSAADKSTAVSSSQAKNAIEMDSALVAAGNWTLGTCSYMNNSSLCLFKATINTTGAGVTGKNNFAKIYFVKAAGVTTLPDDAISYSYAGTYANMPSIITTANIPSPGLKYNATNAGSFGYAVTPYEAPANDAWEADDEATKAGIDGILSNPKYNATYKRAVAVFGKNAAGSEYYVTFGDNTYKGVSVVGLPWAMVLYDDGSAENDLIGNVEDYAYSVSATEGGEALWSGVATVYSAE